ncbi:MAG: F-box protein [Alphaproteobacteria bacterium]|jgi:hypothetical protein
MRKLSFTAFIIMAQGISGFAVASDGHDHLTPLPDEVKQHILGKVPPKDLGAVAGVSKDFHNHTNDEALWRQKALEAGLNTKPEGMTWKKFFVMSQSLTPFIKALEQACHHLLKLLKPWSDVDGIFLERFLDLLEQDKSGLSA